MQFLKDYLFQIIIVVLVLLCVWFAWEALSNNLERSRVQVAYNTLSTKHDQLSAKLVLQNHQVEELGRDKLARDALLMSSMQLAEERSKPLRVTLKQAEKAIASSCSEAMPTLNGILESLK
jgi:sensor domain CHASE-containing protein